MNSLSPAELSRLLRGARPPKLLDVREAEERAFASIEGSKWIPLGELAHRAEDLDDWRHEEVVVYCHHGVRSARGAAILAALGFAHPINLSGGIDRWSLEVDPGVPRY